MSSLYIIYIVIANLFTESFRNQLSELFSDFRRKNTFSQKQGRLETWLIIWVFGDIHDIYVSYIPKYPFAQSLIASSRITKHQFTLTGLPKFKTEFSIDILLHCISAQS